MSKELISLWIKYSECKRECEYICTIKTII